MAKVERAGTYARVSTHVQNDEDRYSLREQQTETERWCREHSYLRVVHEQDVHSGAELDEREGLSHIRSMICKREIDVLIAMEFDRLSRDVTHQSVIEYECDTHGVRIELVAEKIEDTPAGKLYRQVRGFMSEWQRTQIRDKTMRGKRQRAREGRPVPSFMPPYGYWWRDEVKSGFEEDLETALIVRWMYGSIIEGWTLKMIAEDLNTRGIPTGRDHYRMKMGQIDKMRHSIWNEAMVSHILGNKVYYGEYEAFRKRSLLVPVTDKMTGITRQVKRQLPTEEEKRVVLNHAAPPLVTLEVFEAVQERLGRNKETATRNHGDPEGALLRGGFVRCVFCNAKLTTRRERGDRGLFYMCPNKHVAHPRGCQGVMIKAERLDQLVWDDIVKLFHNPEALGETARKTEEQPKEIGTVASLQGVIIGYNKSLKRLAKKIRLLSGNAGDEDSEYEEDSDEEEEDDPLVSEYRMVKAQKKDAEKKLIKLQKHLRERQEAQDNWDGAYAWMRAVATMSARLTYYEKRTVLHVYNIQVILASGKYVENPEFRATVSSDGGPVPNLGIRHLLDSSQQEEQPDWIPISEGMPEDFRGDLVPIDSSSSTPTSVNWHSANPLEFSSILPPLYYEWTHSLANA